MAGQFLTAEWRYLAMLNYEIDPGLLQPYVPTGTEQDTWNGVTFASIVGFLFLKTRVWGLPVPFHTNFEEVNLRFYVRRWDGEGWRRGVVFIKELVPRPAIATMARFLYNENYVSLPMRHQLEVTGSPAGPVIGVEYGWRFQRAWNHVRVTTTGPARPLAAGSEEEFITEHYWGYAAQRDGGSVEYRVEHPPWRVWQVADFSLDCNVAALYGPAFVDALQARPRSVFLAEGSPVIVRRGVRLSADLSSLSGNR